MSLDKLFNKIMNLNGKLVRTGQGCFTICNARLNTNSAESYKQWLRLKMKHWAA